MSILDSIIYGLISGITEFLPVSAKGHQSLMKFIFGLESSTPVRDLLVHIGILLALFISFRETLSRYRREQKLASRSRRKKVRSLDSKNLYDLRLLKTAALPLIAGLLVSISTMEWGNNLLILVGFFSLNAMVLLLAEHTWHGNRDSRTMTGLDGIVMGIAGAISAFPGISRTGMVSAYAVARGADQNNAATWAILLGIPALIFGIFIDLFGVFSVGISTITFSMLAMSFLAGIASFCGGYIGIALFMSIFNNSGFTPFAYYSVGAALFSFVLYLIT